MKYGPYKPVVPALPGALLILGMTLCGPLSTRAAGAEAIESEDPELTEVQVTGTRILHNGPGTPITTITQADMERIYRDFGFLDSRPWKCGAQASDRLREILKRIGTIRAGSTRAELLRMFRPAADSGSRFSQAFDYQGDPGDVPIYVEVEFNADNDRISKVSAPLIRTAPRTPEQPAHGPWVDAVLQGIQAIQPGMTRGQLLEAFGVTDGLYSPMQRTYLNRDCPFFRIDVKLEGVGPANIGGEGKLDRIIQISRPYLVIVNAE